MLVRVEVVSIEGGDTLNRLGGPLLTRAPRRRLPEPPATVLSVGPDVAGFAVGDRVVSLGVNGSHAELRVAHPLSTWKIPDGLATELAACVPVAYGTAHDGLFEFGRLVEGETALIHAGASGVGLAAIQMAKRAGARVIATASSDERLERLREFGLDDGINYRETGLRRRRCVRSRTSRAPTSSSTPWAGRTSRRVSPRWPIGVAASRSATRDEAR